MDEDQPTDLDDARQKVLRAKLGKILDWTQPDVRKTIGPYDPEPFECFATKRKKTISACAAELRKYDDGEIAALLERDIEGHADLIRGWRDFQDREISGLT